MTSSGQRRVTGYGVGAPRITLNPPPIISDRAPTSNDTRYPLGQNWVYKISATSSNIYELGSVSAGVAYWELLGGGSSDVNALSGDSGTATPTAGNISIVGNDLYTVVGSGSTLTITETAGAYPITPYVVGSSTEAGYTTIQSALDAANAAGGGLVWVQAGTYTENLTLYDGCPVRGSKFSEVTITGVHTPPTTGAFSFIDCTLTSATDIFNSAAAGTASLLIETSVITITNGFIFNLANWTGTLSMDDGGDGGSTNNGIVTNTAGATILFVNFTMGAGTGQTMVTSGTTTLQNCEIGCPIDFQTGSVLDFIYCTFSAALTFSNNSTGTFFGCQWSTGATAAITMTSSAAVNVLNSSITSSNNPAVDGAGAGTLTLGNVTFTSNTAKAATLTLGTADLVDATAFRTNASAGDPYFQSLISGGQVFSWGIDNSTTNDDWVMSNNASLGTSDVIVLDGSDFDTTFQGALYSNTEEVTFASSPLLQSNATTGAAPTGATGDVNLMQIQNGSIWEQFILGAGQAIIAPRITPTGLLTSLDLTNAEGAEYNFGMRANAPHTFTIGTSPAFYLEVEVNAADIGGLDPWMCGFRIVQANDATLSNYTDFATIGANATTAADVIILQTQLNTGGVTITNTTDAWTDGQTKIFRILVSRTGVVTYTINGVAPSTTAAFTFDNADVVAPFIRHTFGAATPGEIHWVRYRVGLQ